MKKRVVRKISPGKKPRRKFLHHLFLALISIALLAFLAAISSFPQPYATFSLLDLKSGGEQVVQILTDFSAPYLKAFLGVEAYDQYFFSKALLFIILIIIISTVLERIELFESHKKAARLLSVVISILAIRYLVSAELINAILLPYGALAIAITTFLPFLIYFYFIHHSVRGNAGRRIGWILYGVFFIGLWIQRGAEIGDANLFYIIGIGAVIVSMIFDRNIHQYFSTGEDRRVQRDLLENQRRNVLRDIQQLEEDYWRHHILSNTEYQRAATRYQRRLDEIHRRLSRL